MAAALFKIHLIRLGLENDWHVDSAGTWAEAGFPATRHVQEVMRERGLDLRNHRSKRVTADLLQAFDWIIVMESGQQEALYIEFPDLKDRIFMLTALSGPIYNLPDPEEESLEAYRDLAQEIDGLITAWFEKPKALFPEVKKINHKGHKGKS